MNDYLKTLFVLLQISSTWPRRNHMHKNIIADFVTKVVLSHNWVHSESLILIDVHTTILRKFLDWKKVEWITKTQFCTWIIQFTYISSIWLPLITSYYLLSRPCYQYLPISPWNWFSPKQATLPNTVRI